MSAKKNKDQFSVVLSDFWEEMFPKVDAYAVPVILERIQEWVGEHSILTSIVCDYVIAYVSQAAESRTIVGISEAEAEAIVDRVVQKDILQDWESSAAADHLNKISKVLLNYDRRDSLLILYLQILQRDSVPASNSPEQEVLIRSGLVRVRRGLLKVTYPLYAKVFNLAWVEQQLPGITRPVEVISYGKNLTRSGGKSLPVGRGAARVVAVQSSPPSKLYSKIALLVCGLAVAGAAVSAHFRESSRPALATPSDASGVVVSEAAVSNGATADVQSDVSEADVTSASANSPTAADTSLPKANSTLSDRALFDNGTAQARSSHWVDMMRDYCAIPKESAYYAPAKKQLEKWVTLYKEEIQIARDIVNAEQPEGCVIIKETLPAK